MADEPQAAPQPAIDLDKLADATPEELEEGLKRLRQGEAGKPPEGTPDVLDTPPADPAQAKAEQAPAQEPPKAETPPAKAAPERTPEEIEREGTLRRKLRERERELAELRREREELLAGKKPGAEGPTKQDDPVEYFDREIAAQRAEIQRLRSEQAARDRFDAIRRQESEFETAHPDYRQAVGFLEQHEIKEWERSGISLAAIRQLRQAVDAGRAGNPQAAPIVNHIESLVQRPDVVRLAEKEGRDPEDVAMYLVARDTYLTGRRQMLWDAAEASGRNVAEIAYELAQGRGYRQADAAPAVDPQEAAARARVEQAKAINQASQSLSEAGTTEGGGQARVIRNRQQILNLSDDELDQLIENKEYRNL
jgi:hypothetical protein